MSEEAKKTIQDTVDNNKVVLFMKGTKNFPQCGFSARAVDILKRNGAEFKDVNVLADPALREGIKAYSQWPTIPQVFIGGQFVGGSESANRLVQRPQRKRHISSNPGTRDVRNGTEWRQKLDLPFMACRYRRTPYSTGRLGRTVCSGMGTRSGTRNRAGRFPVKSR